MNVRAQIEIERRRRQRERESVGVDADKAKELESKGWKVWLTTLFPFAFDEDFSEDHVKYWNLKWSVLLRIRAQQKYLKTGVPIPSELEIQPKELVTLLILGRGLAKSSSIEASAVMRGALLDEGYCLYICEAQDQAEEHIGNCKSLINHEESRMLEYYPGMAISEGAVVGGIKTKDRADIFTTLSGWICRGKGLKSRMRGLRIGKFRPDDIKLDDVDGVNDSIAVSMTKLRQITSSIIPTQARRNATIDFGQNLILETGVMNQIYTGQSDALAERTVIGVTKTFSHLDYESRLDPADGRTKHYILPTSIATWAGVQLSQAQKFLHDTGLQTFMAEYQNEFELAREGKVLRNYDDALMVIDEDDFARVFVSIEVLDQFNKYVGHDWSRTKSAYHANVAGKLAVSNQNTPLPGKLFLHDLMSFEAGTLADDVGLRLLESISPYVPDVSSPSLRPTGQTWKQLIDSSLSRSGLELFVTDATKLIEARRDILAGIIPRYAEKLLSAKHYATFSGSHDQNNDALDVYRRVYGLPFNPVNPGTTGGLEWADHYMTVDKKTRHPFFADEKLEDGTWKLGCPGLFIIVKRGKKPYPKSASVEALVDSDLWRFHFNNWKMQPTKLTESGAIEKGPMKMLDDAGQCLQMILHENRISARTLSFHEKVEALIPAGYDRDSLAERTDMDAAQKEMSHVFARMQAEKRLKGKRRVETDEWGNELR